MNTEKKFGFATRQIHAGHMENAAGSLCAPIYQTSTFAFSTVQQGGARFAGEEMHRSQLMHCFGTVSF